MKKYSSGLFSACLLVLLAAGLVILGPGSGYAGFYDQENGKCSNQYLDQIDLKALFRDMAKELCTDSCGECNRSGGTACGGEQSEQQARRTVLVADFVDLQNFQPNGSGLLMGELMRGSLSNGCCYRIVQAEFSKYFKLTEKGLVVLSRDVKDIKFDSYSETECVVGTYSFLNNKLVLFVRRINIVTGQISKMLIREVDFACRRGSSSYTVK